MATLERDLLGEVKNTAGPTGIAPSTGEATADLVSSMGKLGGKLMVGKITSDVEKERDATLEAYTRLRSVGETGSPEDMFAGASERVTKAGMSMIKQLQQEAGSLDAALRQGRIKPDIAYARLDNLVQEKIKAFPGLAQEIDGTVSGYLGFSTRGWAAKRILGLDEPNQDKKNPLTDAKQKRVEKVYNDLSDIYMDSTMQSLDLSLDQAFADPDMFLKRAAILQKHGSKLRQSEIEAATLKAANETADRAYAGVMRESVNTYIGGVVSTGAADFLSQIKQHKNDQDWLRREGPLAVNTLRANLNKAKAGVDTIILSRIPEEERGSITNDAIAPLRSQTIAQIDSTLKMLDTITDSQQYDNLENIANYFTRADFMATAPATAQFMAIYGRTALQVAGQDVGVKIFGGVMGNEFTSRMGASGITAQSEMHTDANQEFAVAMDKYAAGELNDYLAGLPTDKWGERAVKIGYSVENIFTQISGGIMPPDVDGSVDNAINVLKGVMDFDGKGKRESVYLPAKSLALLDVMTSDAVLKNIKNPATVAKLKQFHFEMLNKASSDLVNIPAKSARIGVNENNANKVAYYPTKAGAVPLTSMLFDNQTANPYDANPNVFQLDSNGMIVAIRKFPVQLSRTDEVDLLNRLYTFQQFYNASAPQIVNQAKRRQSWK